jgi:undecaprenyl diphosphate synthase
MDNTLQHIAIIMDGNARWAKARGLPKLEGHRRGADALRATLEHCIKRNVRYVSVYAFSQENWGRPATEVSDLMGLLHHTITRETKTLIKHGIRLHVSGDLTRLPPKTHDALMRAIADTKEGMNLTFNICFSYGSRQEIVQACNILLNAERTHPITEAELSSALYTAALPDPDLLIRTGGEQRISNFLLWQIAYTELYFTDILWPDFDGEALDSAIADFHQRERRYGKR